MFFRRAVKFWVIISALASLAGWTLSALGMLTKTGYAMFAVVVVLAVLLARKWISPAASTPVAGSELKKLRRRFGRFLPACFAVLAALVFISGLLYAPSDHTAMSYRLPRVLQWLSHGRWFWIHTPNYRMNDRACGIEWLSAPVLLFTKSDRALFLLNFIPFLLLPGLIFSVWTRLGVRPRAAWSWMWLVPTGYCFLLQAGGAANDAFPTVYALAMMEFALRAKGIVSGQWSVVSGRRAAVGCLSSNLTLSLLSRGADGGGKGEQSAIGAAVGDCIFPVDSKVVGRDTQSRFTLHVSHFTSSAGFASWWWWSLFRLFRRRFSTFTTFTIGPA